MLRSSHRQFLRRYTDIRHSSSTAPRLDPGIAPDAAAAPAPRPPILRRPMASSFGGISIENIPRNRPQLAPYKAKGGNIPINQNRAREAGFDLGPRVDAVRSTPDLGWGDELVPRGFGSRLYARLHPGDKLAESEKKPAVGAHPAPSGAAPPAASLTVKRREQQEEKEKAQEDQAPEPAAAEKQDAVEAAVTKPQEKRAKPSKRSDRAQSAEPALTHVMRALESTDLTSLFGAKPKSTTSKPKAGSKAKTATLRPSLAGLRVRVTLERKAGDYSRYLPRPVGVGKLSRRALSPVRYARHALGFRRDMELDQRSRAMKVIGSMVRPAQATA
ncbi:hypothetical protein EW146_g2689 [Bondarzewia mesenterica]|uniref:Uncharacterized protein n=1 Tax=Bondarzewia mesenterica TaxID=1095465 RepID=A0A4S4M248_9AGAM|nr:hypothetical protein EW146_g2689 [Bondarzewia mesenterica]